MASPKKDSRKTSAMAAALSTHVFHTECGVYGRGVAVCAEHLNPRALSINLCRSCLSGGKLRIVSRDSLYGSSKSLIDEVDATDSRLSSFRKPLIISRRKNFCTLCSSNPKSTESISSKSQKLENQNQFVNWFREAWPYIHRHRGCTFVIVIPGEVIAERHTLNSILQDISLLHGLGIKLVIVPGAQIQIDQLLRERNCEPKYVGAYRITDSLALEACKEAAGRIHVDIEAKLSQGPSIVALRRHGIGCLHKTGGIVSSGNLVSAKRRGVVNGIDFGATGEVRKIEVARVKEALEKSNIVLLSNLGYSKSGEVLNCNTCEVATACAIALQADKLLCLLDGPMLHENNQPLRSLTIQEADQLIQKRASSQSNTARDHVEVVAGLAYLKSLGLDKPFSEEQTIAPRSLSTINVNSFVQHEVNSFQINCDGSVSSEASLNANLIKTKGQGFAVGGEERLSRTYGYLSELTAAAFSCRGGVRHVQLVDTTVEGALLLELYSPDGIGTMVSSDEDYVTRPATAGDYLGIQYLLQPLVESGMLINHQQLLKELFSFTVVEKDDILIACSALFPYSNAKCGEVAAFVVAPEWRNHGVGDGLLDYMEKKAEKMGLARIFLLSTQTADWFMHRGFLKCSIDMIPKEKQNTIDFARGSEYCIKYLLSGVDGVSNAVETVHITNELSIY